MLSITEEKRGTERVGGFPNVTQRVLVELDVWNWAKGVGGRSEPDIITAGSRDLILLGSLCESQACSLCASAVDPFQAQVSASQTESGAGRGETLDLPLPLALPSSEFKDAERTRQGLKPTQTRNGSPSRPPARAHSQTAAPTAGRPASGRREQISRFTQRTMGRLKGAPRALFGPAPARPTSARELTPVTLAIVAAHFGAGHKGARKPCRVRKDGGGGREPPGCEAGRQAPRFPGPSLGDSSWRPQLTISYSAVNASQTDPVLLLGTWACLP
ncbi:uncharacterized protein [Bos taurus]|uniref:uncharacterized protein n=1 Tax=Bos taurus TaxID=9913 RepID=UPI0028CB13BC|nr:uncharacterized protein LOC132342553 [Bos taurus]